jgi:riboflavin kinase/FMN adenylyltransferase
MVWFPGLFTRRKAAFSVMDVELDVLGSDSRLPASVVGIGVFDGVHLAHRKLIERVAALGRERGVPSVILTFEPHPQEVLTGRPLPRLSSLDERLRRIASCGVDHAKVIRFSRAFSQQTPEEFVQRMLVERLGARGVVVGFNFTFGRGGRGTPRTLVELGAKAGFTAETIASVSVGEVHVSSSAVRLALSEGNVDQAARLLGRPYAVTGHVKTGSGRGRTIGFPTANLAPEPEHVSMPGRGVYSADATPEDGATFPALVNIGTRPTFDGDSTTIVPEIYIHGFSGDLVGRRLTVNFLEKLRDEQRFPSVESLVAQIRADLDRALARRKQAAAS